MALPQQSQMPQQSQPQGFNFGQSLGRGIGGIADKYLPKQFQGMGSMLGNLGGSMADRFAQPYMNKFANNPMFQQAQNMLPQVFSQGPQMLSGLGGQLGNSSNQYLRGLGGAMSGLGNVMRNPYAGKFNRGGAIPMSHGGMHHPHYGVGGMMLGHSLMGPAGGLLGEMLPFARGGSPLHAHEDQMVPGHGGMDHWPWPPHMSGGYNPTQGEYHPYHPYAEHFAMGGSPHMAMGGAHMAGGGTVPNLSQLMQMVMQLAPYVAKEVEPLVGGNRRHEGHGMMPEMGHVR